MRILNKTTFLFFLTLLVTACQRETTGPEEPQLFPHTLVASMGEESVKTILDPEDDTKVLWTAKEQVNVFVADASYLFTGENEADAVSADFSGMAPEDLGTYVMLSPYNASATKSGDDICTTLPAAQTGYAGGYAHGTAITAGLSSTASVSCKHVSSGIRFKFSQADDITKVVFRGRGNEGIAGNFTFSFDGDGYPVAGAGSENQVVLTPPGGAAYFATDTWYYIVILPTVFDEGITITATSVSRGTGTYSLTGALTFSRAKFKQKQNLDTAMSWAVPTVTNTCYGPANTFCLGTGESQTVDVSPRQILSGWIRGSEVFTGAVEATSCAVLWNTGTVTASLENQLLTLNAGDSEGSALVTIKSGETILWSFLVWVTASAPAETTLPGGAVVMPTLGGNCYFQWGRKDPLLPGQAVLAHPGDANALSTSIRNPNAFINKGDNFYDWYAAESYDHLDATLWGGADGNKTVWDPCPAGWRVPSAANYATLAEASYAATFDKLGILVPGTSATEVNPDFNWDADCWTRNGSEGESVSLLMRTDGLGFQGFSLPGNSRYLGLSIRCVKE